MGLNIFIIVSAFVVGWLFGLYSRGLLTARWLSFFGRPCGFSSPQGPVPIELSASGLWMKGSCRRLAG